MSKTKTKRKSTKAGNGKSTTVKQHGVAQPREGTDSAKVFAIADELSKKAHKPAVRKDVLEAAAKSKINSATAATQFGRWRQFHGLEGRA